MMMKIKQNITVLYVNLIKMIDVIERRVIRLNPIIQDV